MNLQETTLFWRAHFFFKEKGTFTIPAGFRFDRFDREKAEKKRSKLADDGDLSELFDALELEDDGKAVTWLVGEKKGGWKTPQLYRHY